jgi:hypothetical protein
MCSVADTFYAKNDSLDIFNGSLRRTDTSRHSTARVFSPFSPCSFQRQNNGYLERGILLSRLTETRMSGFIREPTTSLPDDRPTGSLECLRRHVVMRDRDAELISG